MNPGFLGTLQFLPEQASTIGRQVDYIFWGLTAISAFMTLGLFAVITFFLIRYRSTSDANRVISRLSPTYLEVTWTATPILIFIGLFVWGALVFAKASKPPAGAMPIYVIGRQWYWDVLHENGRREIGDLHVPVGQPVQLIMTSTDVIHDYAVPAFRIKRDVLPGKYTTEWFTATKPGKYRIFCNQYCGTKHGLMVGMVYALGADDYETWLNAPGSPPGENLTRTGARLFRQYSCSGCHGENSSVHAPSLAGIYGQPVPLEGGGFVTADDQYLRDSILLPSSQIVAGYKPIMPAYAKQISEEDVITLVAYIKSLSQPSPPATATSSLPTSQAP